MSRSISSLLLSILSTFVSRSMLFSFLVEQATEDPVTMPAIPDPAVRLVGFFGSVISLLLGWV